MSLTGLLGLTMIAMPSSATTVSVSPLAFSSSLRALEESPMSQRPSETAVIPVPEPVGLYVNFASGLFAVKASPSAPMTFSIEVEPSVDTVPLTWSETASPEV